MVARGIIPGSEVTTARAGKGALIPLAALAGFAPRVRDGASLGDAKGGAGLITGRDEQTDRKYINS